MRKHRLYGVSLATLAAVGGPIFYQASSSQPAMASPSNGQSHTTAQLSGGTHQAQLVDYSTTSSDTTAFWNLVAEYKANPDGFQPVAQNWARWMAAVAPATQQATDADGDNDGDTAAPAPSTGSSGSAPAPVTQAPVSTPAPASGGGGAGGSWAALRQCESGGNYAENTGNGYYGAYQFSLSTWQGLGYSGLPSNASPATQDAAAQQLQASSGWSPWPACSAKLGL